MDVVSIKDTLCSIFGFDDMVAAAVLKDFETAMRRTGRWADGSLLTIDELGQAVGLDMFTVRGRNAMAWEPEFLNRCDERYRIDITDPDTAWHYRCCTPQVGS